MNKQKEQTKRDPSDAGTAVFIFHFPKPLVLCLRSASLLVEASLPTLPRTVLSWHRGHFPTEGCVDYLTASPSPWPWAYGGQVQKAYALWACVSQ